MTPADEPPARTVLQARLLGGCALWFAGRPIPETAFARKRALLVLLSLLLARGHALPHEVLVERLWPKGDLESGVAGLHNALSSLRAALGGGPTARLAVVSRGELVVLSPSLQIEVDVTDYEEAARAALAGGDLSALRAAAAQYTGPLLPGFPYEDWLNGTREALARLQERILAALAEGEAAADPEAAIERLYQQVEADVLNEGAARQLMRLLADTGRRAQALRVYERLARALREELELEPEPQTLELQAALHWSPPPAHPASVAMPLVPQPVDAGLPEGVVTFLLTDIEGSTALWDRNESAMRVALARHDALVAEAVAGQGGRLLNARGEGGSTFSVFAAPTAALVSALALQQSLLAEPWPAEIPIRVRMGIDTGVVPHPDGDYSGPVLNRAARIRGLGHGGQVLLTGATAALVADSLAEGMALRELGRHRLKGIEEPQVVYQLLHPSLPGEFPPLRSPQAPKHNLSEALTSFVGREQEQAAVQQLLEQTRLLTLTGAGGCGKTRLALQVAGELLERFPQGVWLVELASLTSPALVPQAVTSALGVPEESGRPLLATLTSFLAARRLLLVLDNCEHLVGACAELATTLLQSCRQLRILATSREGLEVAGETTYLVPSLAVPDPRQLPPLEDLLGFAAVRLFVERARARRPSFALTAQNAPAVVQICRRLDGIPLAIELAAARVDTLLVEAIAARLDDCFRLLSGGPRLALPRQKTLRATLDWSYGLLSREEQTLLPRLSVFAGGWTLEAAEVVCVGEGVETWEVLDLLASLVHKSLVLLEERQDRRGGEARYRLLDTVRQYGQEQLLATGTAAAIRRRFIGWCLAFTERAETGIEGPELGTWLDRIDEELDNLRSVLARSTTDAEEAEAGMRLATMLRWYWAQRMKIDEGRWWLEATLAAGGAVPVAVRAPALYAAGRLADLHGDRDWAHGLYAQCLPLLQQLGDNNLLAYTLHWLSWHAHRLGDHERGATLREESLRLFRASADKQGLAQTLIMLGSDAQQQGDYRQATTYLEEALILLRESGVKWNLGVLLMELGGVARTRGDYAGAEAYLTECLTLFQELGFSDGIIAGHCYLGEVATARGEFTRAAAWFQQGLAQCGDGEQQTVHLPQYLNGLGNVARLQGDSRQAVALLEESLAGLREAGVPGLLARVLTDLGYAFLDQGDAARAQALYQESLGLLGAKGYKPHAVRNLEGLAAVAAKQGLPERAARQFGTAAASRDAMGAPLPPSERPAYERNLAVVRATLDAETFQAAWATGRTLGLEEAIAEALETGTGTTLHAATGSSIP